MQKAYCCSCAEELRFLQNVFMTVTLYEEGKDPQNYTAEVCNRCAKDAAVSTSSFRAIEAIINARIRRINSPSKRFTP